MIIIDEIILLYIAIKSAYKKLYITDSNDLVRIKIAIANVEDTTILWKQSQLYRNRIIPM